MVDFIQTHRHIEQAKHSALNRVNGLSGMELVPEMEGPPETRDGTMTIRMQEPTPVVGSSVAEQGLTIRRVARPTTQRTETGEARP